MNKFKYSLDNKRYHTFNYYLKNKFNTKVFKVSLNAGFTCPNIDGTVSTGGCIYCSHTGSGDFAGNPNDNLVTQFNTIKNMMEQKWPDSKYIAYFQAYSNTYAPVNELRKKYETVLNIDNVVGLSIATRADCINEEIIAYLSELNKKTLLWVELGLQSIHQETAKLINRGHTLKQFITAVKMLRKANINVCVHIINGLPNETKTMMLETVKFLSTLNIQGIKIHMLHIIKNTSLAKLYETEKFHVLTKDEYIDITCDQLELLPPNVVIHRITGDGKEADLIAPEWILKKFIVLNDIDKELNRRDSYQGKNYLGNN